MLQQFKGIRIPEKLKDTWGNKWKKRSDLHDIEYDLFSEIEKSFPSISAEFNIPQFRAKVDQVAGKTGKLSENLRKLDLDKEIGQLHSEAGQILKGLFEKYGVEFLEKVTH